jgi:hypothetical protein
LRGERSVGIEEGVKRNGQRGERSQEVIYVVCMSLFKGDEGSWVMRRSQRRGGRSE